MISPVSFNGVALNDGFFSSDLRGVFNADKALTLDDILGDGQVFGRSKVADRKLVLNITAAAQDLARLATLNQMVAGNALKMLIIDTDIGRLCGYAEVTTFAWADDTPLMQSCQLTMPDPHWYALQAATLSLEPHIDNGVIFGDPARIQLDAGGSDAAARGALDAGGSDAETRTQLDAGGGI